MTATLHIQKGVEVSAAQVISKLTQDQITGFNEPSIVQLFEKRKGAELSVPIAAGTAAVDDRPERVEYRVPISDERSGLLTKVSPGQLVATIGPIVQGTDGLDVFGNTVPRKIATPLQIGRNLQQAKGGIVSRSKGTLRLSGQTLSVEPLLELRGDDDNLSPIQFDGDAVIKGTLNEGRSIQITGSLSVGGAVEMVQLKAGASVVIQGGIVGKQRGRYTIGGDLRCRFISGGVVVATRDIHVQSDITDCRIACGGHLTVTQGAIVGGVVAVNGGVSCGTLGHTSGTPTLIEAGEGIASHSILQPAAAQIETNQKRVRSIRETIEPLLHMMKTLTSIQREKVTELFYEADELETATKKMILDRDKRAGEFVISARPRVDVDNIVHAGVTVRFPQVKTTFNAPVRGPFFLDPCQDEQGVWCVVLTRTSDESRVRLQSQAVDVAAEAKQSHNLEAAA